MTGIVTDRPGVIYFGMAGVLSRAPLAALLAAGIDVRAAVVPASADGGATAPIQRLAPPRGAPARPASFAALLRQTVVDVAWERGIPAWELARPGDWAALDLLASYQPDLIAVSCFSLRLPAPLLAVPRLGCLNLHPSLLPANRGPAPLFWTFRQGVARTGVTVHLMDTGLDSGPIVAQEGFDLADGLTSDELELHCAALGAALLVRAVHGLAAGTLTPQPQDETRATTYPWPRAADFVVTPDRPARWAFNFLRGTAGWGQPHQIAVAGERFTVHTTLAYEPAGDLGAPFVRAGSQLRLQCAPGVLTVTVTGQ